MKIYNDEIDLVIETKLKPKLKMLYDLRVRGFKDYQIADYLGISRPKFNEALARSQVVRETYDDATQFLCSQLRNVVVNRALGTDGKTDKDGNEIGADANLALRILEKLDPEFKNSQDVHIDMGMTIEQVIHALAEKKKQEVEDDAQA